MARFTNKHCYLPGQRMQFTWHIIQNCQNCVIKEPRQVCLHLRIKPVTLRLKAQYLQNCTLTLRAILWCTANGKGMKSLLQELKV